MQAVTNQTITNQTITKYSRPWRSCVGWILCTSLLIACTRDKAPVSPYHLSGHVVRTQTNLPAANLPLRMGLCDRGDPLGLQPLCTWTTDSAGAFEVHCAVDAAPDRLAVVLLEWPPQHRRPEFPVLLTGRVCRGLRVEVPAFTWLKVQPDLEAQGPGVSLLVRCGEFFHIFYGPEPQAPLWPLVANGPMTLSWTYRESPGAVPLDTQASYLLPPLDTLVWAWRP